MKKFIKNNKKTLDKKHKIDYYIQALVCECKLWPSSSVGRAADWKSACRWFDSAPRHHRNGTHAGVAQWQSSWFVISRLWVRVQSPAPQRTARQFHMGRFQSGQMDQTVNLTSSTSVVRIHLCPPQKGHTNRCVLFVCGWGVAASPVYAVVRAKSAAVRDLSLALA